MSIQLDLDVSEVDAILRVLGDLPTKTGAWPLFVKIKTQADSQATFEDANEEVSADTVN